jgi:hypothetical protein
MTDTSNSEPDPEFIERISRLKKLIETPVDVERLIEEGVLAEPVEDQGQTWYRLLEHDALPEHAREQVVGVKKRRADEAEETVYIRFE